MKASIGSITPEAVGEFQELQLRTHQGEYTEKLDTKLIELKTQFDDITQAVEVFNKQKGDIQLKVQELQTRSDRALNPTGTIEQSAINLLLESYSTILKQCDVQIMSLAEKTGKIRRIEKGIKIAKPLAQRDPEETCKAGALHYHQTQEHSQIRSKRKDDIDVVRFGLYNTSKDLVGVHIGHDSLHPIEAELFSAAFTELDQREDATAFIQSNAKSQKPLPPPNNVVLVDIFVRDKDGNIATDNGLPETHTVALWKKGEQLVLIDPSNTKFSSELVSPLQKLSSKKIETIQVTKSKIYTHGSEKHEVRDCVDIAVKIAFELNELQRKEKAEIIGIEKRMINQISNQPEALSKLGKQHSSSLQPNAIKEALESTAFQDVVNGLQSSNPEQRKTRLADRDNRIESKKRNKDYTGRK